MRRASTSPRWRAFELVEHFPGFRHVEDALVLAVHVVVHADGLGVTIAEVDSTALFLRDRGRQRDFHTAFLDAVLERADTADMGGMREHPPRVVLELVPLLE